MPGIVVAVGRGAGGDGHAGDKGAESGGGPAGVERVGDDDQAFPAVFIHQCARGDGFVIRAGNLVLGDHNRIGGQPQRLRRRHVQPRGRARQARVFVRGIGEHDHGRVALRVEVHRVLDAIGVGGQDDDGIGGGGRLVHGEEVTDLQRKGCQRKRARAQQRRQRQAAAAPHAQHKVARALIVFPVDV